MLKTNLFILSDIINKLNEIDLVLQKVTYESNLKIIIFESFIRKYVSTEYLVFLMCL